MGKTNDKTRFTFRIPKDLDDYIKAKAHEWKSTRTAALIRILNEYSKQYPVKYQDRRIPHEQLGAG